MKGTNSRPEVPRGPILVISDLHMTSGLNPIRGTWSPTEDFFWDDDFAEFLERYGKGGRSTLVINGDMFDFLQVLEVPDSQQARDYHIPDAHISARFGLRCSEPAAIFQIDVIFHGHRRVFQALAEFLGEGNHVKIIKGNHDVQLFWDGVQRRIRDRLEEFGQSGTKKAIRENLEFLPWFYYVPGLLYVEHGNQYESSTSFENFLCPLLPVDYRGSGKNIELDLGGIVIRYFSNRMEVIDPLADNYRPLSQYLKSFIRHHPLVFLGSLRDAVRYLTKAVRKAYRMKTSRGSAAYRKIAERNALGITEEAVRFSGSRAPSWLHERLLEIHGHTAIPSLSVGPNRFLRNLITGPLRALAWIVPLYLVTYVPLASSWLAETVSSGMTGWGRMIINILFILRIPQIVMGLLLVMAALEIRTLQSARSRRTSNLEDPVLRLRTAAAFIANRLSVPFVTFGHTHVEDIQMLASGSTYFNTGTWISVFSERENLYRNVRQFTFALFEGGKGKLLQWDPAERSAKPVIVMDAAPYALPERASVLSTLWKLLRRK
jgi:UDP-2,3-diacylglucosamine pyrophosphatase LpxH